MGASMLHAFNQTLNTIVESPACSVNAVDMCSEHHFTQIRAFTKDISPFNNTLLHDLCLRHAKTQPNACAIDSWDGNLTYEELDDLTSRLAHHLIAQGVRPDTFVLCCFPKSTWAIVGRLAILKAGGAYISIDASDPPFYLESIIRRTQTRIMLTAPEYVTRFQSMVSTVVEVTPAVLSSLPVKNSVACRDVRPDSPCLILFTSGSTGAPKGIIQEHRSYATAICDYVAMLGLDASSRVLQFDDYAFDISNNDFLAPLTAGGCCCVPTPEKTIAALRENINALRVNMTFLTPTVAIQLGPRDMPTLKTVCIGGEPPSRDLLRDWAGRVRLINQYGMGEAATFCAYNDSLDADRSGIIGRAGSGALWIASPTSPEQLVPLGAVGEILIEGPHLARGYLDGVAAKSDVGFLSRPPAWMRRIHPHRGSTRVYRSGDLGRYHADGTVEHLGRKDTMLKLNGCRVESSEVECVLRRCLSDEDAVVVDVLGTMRTDEEPVLAAFVYVRSERKPGVNIGIQTIDEDHMEYPLVRGMRTIAEAQLPEHMIPSLFLLVDRIPRTKSNKTDRRRLHMHGQDFLRGEKNFNCA
jgi:amino acid adenylation domain-containing protein